MKILYRLVLSLYTFCLAVISLFIGLVLTHVVPYSLLTTYADMVAKNESLSRIAIAVVTIFFIASLWFLLSGVSKDRSKKAIEKVSELGGISISLESIESIVLSAVKQLDGVMDIKAIINNKKEDVKIRLKATVTPERSIPELSAVIQSRAKEVVERVAGVKVASVLVEVSDVVQTMRPAAKGRVE